MSNRKTRLQQIQSRPADRWDEPILESNLDMEVNEIMRGYAKRQTTAWPVFGTVSLPGKESL